jgi:hypothetical protein
VPDASPEGISPDAAAAEEVERLLRVGEVRRVLVPAAISRFDGLAITAVVVRRESVEVLFHFVGPAVEPSPGFASMAAFRAVHDSLVAPRLTDHLGRVYEPVRPGPIQSRGGRPGVSGAWRYFPAPADATAFVVEWLGGRWVISG